MDTVWSLRRTQCGSIKDKCRMKGKIHADVRGAVVPEEMTATQGICIQGLIEREEVMAETIAGG